jgi:polar amino acid transport system permease protein
MLEIHRLVRNFSQAISRVGIHDTSMMKEPYEKPECIRGSTLVIGKNRRDRMPFAADIYRGDDLASLPDNISRRFRVGPLAQWVILAAVAAWLLSLFVLNPKIDLSTIAEFLFSPQIIDGLLNTLLIAICAEVLALVLGVIVGYGRLSTRSAARTASWLYVWLLRSTPLIVQVLIWGNLALFIPKIGFGDFSLNTNVIITPFIAGVLALGVHDGAYLAEVVRSGVQSVSSGQKEAASALGLTSWQIQRHVVLPQALRVMIPALGSFFVLLLKSTTIVLVIGGGDLLTKAENIAAVNFKTVELLLVATIWFLLVTSLGTIGQVFLERRFSRQYLTSRRSKPMDAVDNTTALASPEHVISPIKKRRRK